MIENKTRFSLGDWRRFKLKVTQEEAAKMLGINIATLANYERGKTYPDVPTIERIEKVYGIKYDQIIFLT